MATKANPQDQTIAPKDISTYNNVYVNIEKKLFRKAIQLCDTLLKTYPTNGEMTAAKGSSLACLAQRGDDSSKESAIKLMKQGLMWNLKSARSWHVSGIFYRNDKQYSEALKSYTQVSKLTTNEGNQVSNELLRDISTLQAQTGKWDDYVETRRLLVVNANFPQLHWPGYAVGCHLAGRSGVAIEALNNYQHMLKTSSLADSTKKLGSEEGELCLYRCEIYYQRGEFQQALDSLIANESAIIDTYSLYLYKIRLFIKLGKMEEARQLIVDQILAQNNDHLEATILFFHSHNITFDSLDLTNPATYTQLRALFIDLLTKFPKSSVILQLSLQYYSIEDLKTPLEAYIKPSLTKGVPSLFKTLKSLYKHKHVVSFIEELLTSYVPSLITSNTYPEENKEQTPTTLLSTYIYLAQHFDYLGNVTKAFEYLDLAEKHTPTFIDLYVYRAKIYKHAGNDLAAYHWMDYARSLDHADRWLNNKTAMYAYQCGLDDQGDRTIQLFIKESRGIHTYQYHEQANWWFHHTGVAHLLYTKHYPMALKYLSSIDDFFSQYQEAIYDYHQYTVRKCLLRAYSGMISYLNGIKTHKFYLRGIIPILNALTALHFQVQFEKTQAADVAAPSQTDEGKAALIAQEKTLQDVFESRDLYKWRLNYLKQRQIDKNKNSDEQNEEVEAENAGSTAQNPHYDIYGMDSFKGQFVNKIISKNDYNVFINELQRYVEIILDQFNKAQNDHSKFSHVTDATGNSYQDVPTSIYFHAITAAVETSHPLRAIKYYNQASLSLSQFALSVDVASTSTFTADQVVKKHYAGGFNWYQLQGTTIGHKIKLLPFFYEASKFIAQAQISHFCSNEVLATANMIKTETILSAYQKQYEKAVSNGTLVKDVKQLLIDKLSSISSASNTECFAKRFISLAGVVLAAYYTKIAINFAFVKDTFDAIVTALPTNKTPCQLTRTAMSALVYALQQSLGNTYISSITQTVPIITGFVAEIKSNQCTPFVDASVQSTITTALESVQNYAKKYFPHDTAFMSVEESAANSIKFACTGPSFVAPPKE